MIKVTIVDVLKEEKGGVIVLLDEVGHRAMTFPVKPFEGEAIARHLLGYPTQRPITFDLAANLLQAVEAQLEEVRIEELNLAERVLYAVAKLRQGDRVQEVKARSDDALALAVRTGSPIYVAEEVMKTLGVNVPEKIGQEPQLAKGLKMIQQEISFKEQLAKLRPADPPEQAEQMHKDLITFVFGSET